MRRHLSVREVAKLTGRGRYAVGHGAYLQISRGGQRSWIFRYFKDRIAHHVGLGSATYVTLNEVRDKAFELRRDLIRGNEPGRRIARKPAANMPASMTFAQAAADYIKAHEPGWRGGSSKKGLTCSMRHASALIGAKPVSDIGVADVQAVLDTLASTPVAQRRVKTHVAAVLEWSHRAVDRYSNPARRKLLPRNSHVVEHFPALDYHELPAFVAELRRVPEITARALELMLLCATRPNEVLGARWREIDIANREWLIPAARMRKTNQPHRIPLSDSAVALLQALPREAGSDVIFIGRRTGASMYDNALQRLIERMGRKGISAHACSRACLKTWARETTRHPHEVIEQALAHTIPDAVERAYNRGDLLDKRRALMEDWARFLSSKN